MNIVKIFLPLLVLAAGAGAFVYMQHNPPSPNIRAQPPAPVLEVAAISITNRDYRPQLQAQGVVYARQQTVLHPEVPGKIYRRDDNFAIGKRVNRGQVLVSLDATRYRAAVDTAKAAVTGAEATVIEEEARGILALDNWKRSGKRGTPGALTLRKPQLKAAKAKLEQAQIQLRTARLDVAATRIVAPYDGIITKVSASIGQLVNSGTVLGSIMATDAVEVKVPLAGYALSSLPDIPFPVEVQVQQQQGKTQLTYAGSAIGREAVVNEQTRQLGIIVVIPNPFEYPQPLLPGQFVTVTITATSISNVARIPLEAINTNNQVNLIEAGALTRIRVEKLFTDQDAAIVRGLENGQQLVTVAIHSLPVGTRVRPISQ